MGHMFLIGDRSGEQAGGEAIKSDWKRTLEHYMPRVVEHYFVGIWVMVSAECMEGLRAPTPQRCSAGFSVYQKCVLERCGSEIQYHPKP
ncbi:hypothetical protein TNCV_2465731 [Trichonephila clavipes]|uniref:Uncharacterized protein n=1 Tax=Trichonephila clavipes TaxID=2585209 RepID=A0A8X6R3X7_TRICX|nr:hypothetical protein TNCV_2465731 [Trichonephila clavipes]